MADSWNKKEREQKKKNAKKRKEEKRLERKESASGKSPDDMLAYVDEYGNLTDTPPEKTNRPISYEIPPTVANSNALNTAEPEVRTGVVSFFDESKGYGFIKDNKSGDRVFVHISALPEALAENTKVTYDIQHGPRGLTAVNVAVVK